MRITAHIDDQTRHLLSVGDADRPKRSFAPFGTAEQRISFKEVQLKEKAKPTPPPSNGDDVPKASTSAMVTEPDQYLEKLTGRRSASPARKRKRGSKKGKEKAVDVQDDNAMDTT